MNQLVLFGAASTMEATAFKSVAIVSKFQYAKEKVGDKWVVKKTATGEKVLAKDNDGNPIKAGEVIKLLPRSSKDNTDLKDVTGLSGQALMSFEVKVRNQLADDAIAEITRLRAQGNYTFGSESRNARTGAITLTMKPVFGGSGIAVKSDAELAEEMARRGYKVEKAPALPDPNQKELPGTEPAPAKKNAKK